MAPRIGGSPAPVALPKVTSSSPAPAGSSSPGGTGFSASSFFQSATSSPVALSGWKANDKYLKTGFESLSKIDSPEARRAMEILGKAGTATKDEIAELGSAEEGTGLLGKLKGQLEDGGKSADEARAMLDVVKGFISWMANNMFIGK